MDVGAGAIVFVRAQTSRDGRLISDWCNMVLDDDGYVTATARAVMGRNALPLPQ
jgi:hypothetical protein